MYEVDYPICAVRKGTGSRSGMAILECVTMTGQRFCVLAPGSPKEKRELWKNREKCLMGKRVTVRFRYFRKGTEAHVVPLDPTAIRVRDRLPT